MYYMVPDEEETNNTNLEKDFLSGFLEIFDTETRVVCSFHCEPELASHICENLLGIDAKALNTDDIKSSILETCNMLTGNFLSEKWGDSNWQLGIPTLQPDDKLKSFMANNQSVKGAVQFDYGRIVFEIFSPEDMQK